MEPLKAYLDARSTCVGYTKACSTELEVLVSREQGLLRDKEGNPGKDLKLHKQSISTST
jgi:hypothetical protein